jgi:hypothetical protein
MFYVNLESTRVHVSNDSRVLSFSNSSLADEEYYGCGFIQNGTFFLVDVFYLYVKG